MKLVHGGRPPEVFRFGRKELHEATGYSVRKISEDANDGTVNLKNLRSVAFYVTAAHLQRTAKEGK